MRNVTRREFMGSGAALASFSFLSPERAFGASANERVKLGVVGCGGRGAWIARFFADHGGYELHAVADYFQEAADACGAALKVAPARRFSGLSGYRKLIASGVEAVALETPPYCFPDHVRAAVAAGLHVYMAKPIAIDVPGTLEVAALARKSAEQKRCFLVDYQIPTDPFSIETMRRVHAGAIGKIVMVQTHYVSGNFSDPPLTGTVESRLQRLVWVNDVALGGGYHVNACIHGVDAGLWVMRARPTSALGVSAIGRPNPHGDSHDLFSVSFEFADGTMMNHVGSHLNAPFNVRCVAYGQTGSAEIGYNGTAFVRGGSEPYEGGEIKDLYAAGARRNVKSFRESIVRGDASNPTVEPSVNSALATILGREAAARRTRITMGDLIKENRRIEPDLRGLKA